MEKITDVNYILSKKDHGRIIKVGKNNFRRIFIKGEYPFWEDGFTDIAWVKDTPIYKKDNDWYRKV